MLNPQLAPLIQLQILDLRAAEIKEQQRKIPELLESAERPLREAQKSLHDATTTAEKTLKSRRDRESDLDIQEAHIVKMKGRVSEIKKNVEYQAHLFEIQVATKKKGEIEEQILVLMDDVEQQQQAVKETTAIVSDAEARFEQKKAELETLNQKLGKELAELDEKQRAVADTIDKSLLGRYHKLKSTCKDLALASIKNGICSGCRLQLPPQLVAEVKRADALLYCSFCHRILYWEGDPGQGSSPSGESADQVAQHLPEGG